MRLSTTGLAAWSASGEQLFTGRAFVLARFRTENRDYTFHSTGRYGFACGLPPSVLPDISPSRGEMSGKIKALPKFLKNAVITPIL
ncbi:hypothetical protein ACQ3G6_13135 [Allorhizobium undicola]|uniref:hypothetical protein n=1 Tax=Allorhizobium undicola TaxID=78527 RepID=UPI003D354B3B